MAFENGLGMAGFSVKGRSEMGRMGSNYLKCDCVEYALHQGAQQVTHSLTFGKVGFANRPNRRVSVCLATLGPRVSTRLIQLAGPAKVVEFLVRF